MSIQKIRQYICLILHTLIYWKRVKPIHHYGVAIVRSDAIGDFVIWLSSMSAYKKKYSDKSILLICPKPNEPLAKAVDLFDKVITFDRKKVSDNICYHVKFMLEVKKYSADMVINPTWQHQMSADYICAMINSRVKIGTKVNREGLRDKWCDKYFTELVDMPLIGTVSEMEAIEYFTKQVVDASYIYHLTDFTLLYKDFKCPIEDDYCLVSFSSSQEIKNWPIENFAKLFAFIPRKYAIVLTGYGDKDLSKANILCNSDNGFHKIINLVNKTSVVELLLFISKAKFVIGNDSVAIHMAAACRVPSICILHGAHFGRFVPYPNSVPESKYHPICVFNRMECYNCNYICVKDVRNDRALFCLRNISVKSVSDALLRII